MFSLCEKREGWWPTSDKVILMFMLMFELMLIMANIGQGGVDVHIAKTSLEWMGSLGWE